jgi:valine dehydrogenase (NAD+)
MSAGNLGSEHEEVVFRRDRQTGLRCIIAIYSTQRGPALGGTRFYPYPDEDRALADVLDLSRAMAYKNALADLPHGGGKAVILGDPSTDKSEELLRAYGRIVDSLGGRYITACDVGTYVRDMDVVATQCRFVTGRSPEHGGAGDSGILTAFGVLRGMQACAQWLWDSDSLAGRRIGVAGAGKVGSRLVGHLLDHEAHVVVADPDEEALDALRSSVGEISVMASEELMRSELDIYSPCALGHTLTHKAAAAMRASAVCGAANNQLLDVSVADALHERGVLYAPDYLVNSGGVIQVADELNGFDMDRAKEAVSSIYDTALEVFGVAARAGSTPAAAADEVAEQRIAAGTWLWWGPRNT